MMINAYDPTSFHMHLPMLFKSCCPKAVNVRSDHVAHRFKLQHIEQIFSGMFGKPLSSRAFILIWSWDLTKHAPKWYIVSTRWSGCRIQCRLLAYTMDFWWLVYNWIRSHGVNNKKEGNKKKNIHETLVKQMQKKHLCDRDIYMSNNMSTT